ncbi:hypothetical protein [Magnetococcus sp. PR-3]|uniref:hypothetical protein n=1 Tax=Magnetococcus sp. PR-3 TaxID=3120355 RepID=UPI002FCE2429
MSFQQQVLETLQARTGGCSAADLTVEMGLDIGPSGGADKRVKGALSRLVKKGLVVGKTQRQGWQFWDIYRPAGGWGA